MIKTFGFRSLFNTIWHYVRGDEQTMMSHQLSTKHFFCSIFRKEFYKKKLHQPYAYIMSPSTITVNTDNHFSNSKTFFYWKNPRIHEIKTAKQIHCNLLLFRHTNGATPTTGCFGVLTTDSKTPVMSHTTMSTDLLQSFQIFTQFRVQIGRR